MKRHASASLVALALFGCGGASTSNDVGHPTGKADGTGATFDVVDLKISGTKQSLFLDFDSTESINVSMKVEPRHWLVSPEKPLPPGAPSNGPKHWGLVDRTYAGNTHFEISTPWPSYQHGNVTGTVTIAIYEKTGGANPSEDRLDRTVSVPVTCAGSPTVTCQGETQEELLSSSVDYTRWDSSIRPIYYRGQLTVSLTDGGNAPFQLHDKINGTTTFNYDLGLADIFALTY